jgi:hypothetical protein
MADESIDSSGMTNDPRPADSTAFRMATARAGVSG